MTFLDFPIQVQTWFSFVSFAGTGRYTRRYFEILPDHLQASSPLTFNVCASAPDGCTKWCKQLPWLQDCLVSRTYWSVTWLFSKQKQGLGEGRNVEWDNSLLPGLSVRY